MTQPFARGPLANRTMLNNIAQQNLKYWQDYKPGEIPTVPLTPPEELLNDINGSILDVGTGDGVLAEELALKGFQVYGIDIAENIISENLKRKSKVNYSVQNISDKTNFPDNFFNFVIFRFTLTNIHKGSWGKLSDETFRILKPGGKIWLLEPLVSQSYKTRYELATNFVTDNNCVYVFYDKNLAEKINIKEDLEKAISEKRVSRIVKHYTLGELSQIFNKFRLADHRIIEVTSPSGFSLNTLEGIFEKAS